MTALNATAAGRSRPEFQVIGLIGIGHFLSHFFIFVLPPLLPLMKEAYGVSYVALGAAITVFNIVSALTQAPIGILVDRIGPRALLLAGIAIGSVAYAGMGLWPNYVALLCFAGLAGLANSVYHPADYAILSANVSDAKMGRAFSLHTFAGYAGGAAAPMAMALAIGLWDWRAGLIGTGVVGAAVFVAMFMWRGRLAIAPRPQPAPGGADAKGAGGINLLRSLPILMCFAFFVLISMSSGGLTGFSVAAFVSLHGMELSEAQLALTMYLVGNAGGILLGGWIADRTVHHERVAMVGFVATAVITFLVGQFAFSSVSVIAIMTVAGVLFGMIMPSRDMLVRAVTPPGQTGTVFGFVTTGFNVGGMLTPLLFGWIMDIGEPRLIFWLAPMFMLVATATVQITRSVQPPRAAVSPAGAD